MKKQTREQWLIAAAALICDEVIAPITDIPTPPYRLSIGWPHANKGKHRTILGQCFPRSMSADGVNEIFLTPLTGAKDTPEILATIVHELIHAFDDCQNGHLKPFKDLAVAAGLTGRMTATTAGPALTEHLAEIADFLGEIPHAPLDTSTVKKEKGRQLKLLCEDCGGIFRASNKVIQQVLEVNGKCPICTSPRFIASE